MATERLYLDPQGKYRKGYIIDGKTYVDPEGKIRVPIGSQTQADSGQWYQLTESGGVAIPASQSYAARAQTIVPNDYITGIANARAQARINALEQAYKQSISALNQQKSEIPQIFTDARNRAAGQYETQRANFNRYAANTGLNVGTAGQAQLAMGTTYQGNLGQLDRAEIKAITDINTQLSNLAAKYRSEVAQAQAEGDYDRMTMLYQQYQNEQNILRQQQQRQQDIDMTTAENRAKLLASMGDFSGYQQLYDLDPTQTAALSALWKQQNAPKYTGGGGTQQDVDLYSAIKMSGLSPYTFLAIHGGEYGISQGEIEGVVAEYNKWLSAESGMTESGIIANMLALGDDAKAYEYLVGLGLAASITDKLYKFYKDQSLAQQSTAGANVSYVPSASSAAVGTVDTQSVVTAVKGLLKKGKSTDYAKNYIADLYDMGMITTSQVSTIIQQLGI